MTWIRVAVVDEYDEDGRRAVLVEDRVVVVSDLAAVILDALPAETSEVAEALVSRFGPPPDGLDQSVREALRALVDVGLINKTSTSR